MCEHTCNFSWFAAGSLGVAFRSHSGTIGSLYPVKKSTCANHSTYQNVAFQSMRPTFRAQQKLLHLTCFALSAAPEILQDQAYGPKVDIFSSGVILYTLLAGFPPFRGQTVKDILKRNLRLVS